jgi:hypothetical protein
MALSEFHRRFLPFTDERLDHGLDVSFLEGLRSPALFVGDGRFQHAQAGDPSLILCFEGLFEVLGDFIHEGCGQRESS